VNWIQLCLSVAEADRVRWILKDFLDYIESNFTSNLSNEEVIPGGHPKSPSRGHLKIPQLNA